VVVTSSRGAGLAMTAATSDEQAWEALRGYAPAMTDEQILLGFVTAGRTLARVDAELFARVFKVDQR
jgi:hypothetical protein